jgi:hypothetical protein
MRNEDFGREIDQFIDRNADPPCSGISKFDDLTAQPRV